MQSMGVFFDHNKIKLEKSTTEEKIGSYPNIWKIKKKKTTFKLTHEPKKKL